MLTYFCPSCWAEIQEDVAVCPSCGFALEGFDRLDYEQKLMNAAFHPIPETRSMAVRILGMLGTPRALPVMERILNEEENDIYLLYQVLEALARIPGQESEQLLGTTLNHPKRLVSQRARQLLAARNASKETDQ
jgi:HEAT repeat protein